LESAAINEVMDRMEHFTGDIRTVITPWE